MAHSSVSGADNTDYVVRMFDSVMRGDNAAFKACFAPEARVWHNEDEIDQEVDAICALMGHLHASSTSVAYENQRIVRTGKLCFVQHVLEAKLRSGEMLHMPAMMRIETDDNGLITRIEEYYDSRATDCLK